MGKIKACARWIHRRGWRLAFLATFMWIGAEMHRLGTMVDTIPGPDTFTLGVIAAKLDAIKDAIHYK